MTLKEYFDDAKGYGVEELIEEICRKCDYSRYEVKNRFIVYFSVENLLPLIGN